MTKKDSKTETPGNGEKTDALATRTKTSLSPEATAFEEVRISVIGRITGVMDTIEDEKDLTRIRNLIGSANPTKKGREEMDAKWAMPSIRIAQGVTKEKPDTAKLGDLFDTNGYVHPQPLKVAPLYVYGANRMFPSKGAKAPICFAPDAKLGSTFGSCNNCKHFPIGLNSTGDITDCDNGVCFMVMSEDLVLYRIEFYRTSRKAGLKFDSLANASKDAYWDRWFNVTSDKQTSDSNEWYIFKVGVSGEDTPAHVRQICDALYDMIRHNREVEIKKHYNRVLGGDKALEDVKETGSIDDDGDAGAGGDDNPDLSRGTI
jgi:hypothetical protein